jgi:hypothetical protein
LLWAPWLIDDREAVAPTQHRDVCTAAIGNDPPSKLKPLKMDRQEEVASDLSEFPPGQRTMSHMGQKRRFG